MSRKLDLITVKEPRSPLSESYRTLRSNIKFSSVDTKLKIILITSSTPAEGKTTTSANLATVLAEAGDKVLIIDCDQRKPNIHKLFGLSNRQGLSDYLACDVEFNEIVQKAHLENLHILSSGSIPPNPSELLASKKMDDFIKSLKTYYDYILLDAPPVGIVTDAQIISQYADGTLLVLAYNQVNKDDAIRAKKLLDNVKSNIIGVVLNKIEENFKNSYCYYEYEEKNNKVFKFNRKNR